MKAHTLPIILCSLLAGAEAAYAQLQWERSVVEFTASASQDVFVATYPFKNTGNRSVEIRDIKTTCGCTTAELEKKTYLPGEQGELSVAFRLRGRRGDQNKSIKVRTSDKTSDIDLRIAGRIEELATIKPVFLFWPIGSEPEWRTSTIEIRNPQQAAIESITPTSKGFEHRLTKSGKPGAYTFSVRPRNGTSENQICVFELALAAPEIVAQKTSASPLQRLYIHARIK